MPIFHYNNSNNKYEPLVPDFRDGLTNRIDEILDTYHRQPFPDAYVSSDKADSTASLNAQNVHPIKDQIGIGDETHGVYTKDSAENAPGTEVHRPNHGACHAARLLATLKALDQLTPKEQKPAETDIAFVQTILAFYGSGRFNDNHENKKAWQQASRDNCRLYLQTNFPNIYGKEDIYADLLLNYEDVNDFYSRAKTKLSRKEADKLCYYKKLIQDSIRLEHNPKVSKERLHGHYGDLTPLTNGLNELKQKSPYEDEHEIKLVDIYTTQLAPGSSNTHTFRISASSGTSGSKDNSDEFFKYLQHKFGEDFVRENKKGHYSITQTIQSPDSTTSDKKVDQYYDLKKDKDSYSLTTEVENGAHENYYHELADKAIDIACSCLEFEAQQNNLTSRDTPAIDISYEGGDIPEPLARAIADIINKGEKTVNIQGEKHQVLVKQTDQLPKAVCDKLESDVLTKESGPKPD